MPKRTKTKRPRLLDDDNNLSDSDMDEVAYTKSNVADSDDNIISDEEMDFRGPKHKMQKDVEEEVIPITDDESSSSEMGYGENVPTEEQLSNDEQDSDANLKSWGKKKKVYFNTDFVDEDRGRSYWEKDKEASKAEERDALAIHQEFLASIPSSAYDFSSELPKIQNDNEDIGLSDLETQPDWKNIDKEVKIKLVKKKHPELLPLMLDFKEKLVELRDKWLPLVEMKDVKTCDNFLAKYIILKYQLLSQYCVNLSIYMTLRCNNDPNRHHPVLGWIKKFQQIMKSIENIDLKYMPLCDKILEKQQSFNEVCEDYLNSSYEQSKQKIKRKISSAKVTFEKSTKPDTSLVKQKLKSSHSNADEEQNNVNKDEETDLRDDNSALKRAVSYQIAKNKGLTPKRKKEYRNPRVRHRMKFRKAEIRRKGQVRKPRKELKRYSGEHSGIHPFVKRSTKLT